MTTENEPLHQSLGDDKVMTAGSSDRVWEKKTVFWIHAHGILQDQAPV